MRAAVQSGNVGDGSGSLIYKTLHRILTKTILKLVRCIFRYRLYMYKMYFLVKLNGVVYIQVH